MVISSGLILNPLKHINLSKECTWFLPEISKLDARKKWIASSVSPKGELIIDNGAIIALKKGKSLLAAGIKNIKGKYISSIDKPEEGWRAYYVEAIYIQFLNLL